MTLDLLELQLLGYLALRVLRVALDLQGFLDHQELQYTKATREIQVQPATKVTKEVKDRQVLLDQ